MRIEQLHDNKTPVCAAGEQHYPLDEVTARRIADIATTNCLLRCWIRETGVLVPENGTLVLDLPASATRIEAGIEYHSPTGFHRFNPVRLSTGTLAGAGLVAALLVTEATAGRVTDPGLVADLLERVTNSQRRVAGHLSLRSRPGDAAASTLFLEAEQALVLGHPLHPAPQSRVGLSEADAEQFAPELRGALQLHWFAADESVVDSSGTPEDLLAEFAPKTPPGTVAVPVHPWQAREVRTRPGVRELFAARQLRHLGPSGMPWYPTASLRTLYNPHSAVMLKVSLCLPITNSTREHLRKELHRGVEIDRLLDAGLGGELASAYPRFGIVRDPAWLAVNPAPDASTGRAESGVEVVLRTNPFHAHDRVVCVAGLLAERPDQTAAAITGLIDRLVTHTGMSAQEVAQQWCTRYVDTVIAPVLWLYRTYGLGLEAHQQNTLVVLDEEGWPCGGWYRDNQGYYLSEPKIDRLQRFLPDIGVGGDNRCTEAVINERLGYYIGINNLIGLAGAFGSHGIADERPLLTTIASRLTSFADLDLVRTLIEAPTLRCKANLLTRVNGLDELVGPLETQSVYRDIVNPFVVSHS